MSRRKIECSSEFKKDLKIFSSKLAVLPEWNEVIHCLLNDLPLLPARVNHKLQGKYKEYKGCKDCHILPDLVLIYKKLDNGNILLIRINTHSEIFG